MVASPSPAAELNCLLFFFNDTATTEIYTLSLHDALPISRVPEHQPRRVAQQDRDSRWRTSRRHGHHRQRSEEHTSELQSPCNLVCRLLLEKKPLSAHVGGRLGEQVDADGLHGGARLLRRR